MRLKGVLAIFASLIAPSVALAQAAQHVDSQTGNYVPTPDPGAAYYPDANKPNPNRLGNRLAKRNSPNVTEPPSSVVSAADDGLTPAQRMARNGGYNGQAMAMTAPNGSPEQTDANGFVAMGGMPMYSPPGSSTDTADPFAKPDWWPQ